MRVEINADEIIRILDLKPLPIEGGHFRETYRSGIELDSGQITGLYGSSRTLCTAIYYLLTDGTVSVMHRVPGDEIFHFYLGDPVEMLLLYPDGTSEMITLGSDLVNGEVSQFTVKGGVWQGAKVRDGGKFALMGTTMSPGFDYADFEEGKCDALIGEYPEKEQVIRLLTK